MTCPGTDFLKFLLSYASKSSQSSTIVTAATKACDYDKEQQRVFVPLFVVESSCKLRPFVTPLFFFLAAMRALVTMTAAATVPEQRSGGSLLGATGSSCEPTRKPGRKWSPRDTKRGTYKRHTVFDDTGTFLHSIKSVFM